ncbi:phage tail protein [Nitrospira sp. BLG_1]|uniref:phage tail protein n=1 Tax=Nitrospira sp. BLG_1 TaxID=3395883 RepID=UPI0039BC76DD
MSLATRNDPTLAYNFRINLLDSTSSGAAAVTSIALTPLFVNPLAGFSECTGLEMTLETEDYEEGGNNGTVLKFPKRAKWGEITLKKGITKKTDLFDWYYGFTQGVTKRKDGVIILMNEKHEPHTVWKFRRGLPIKYVAPQLNAQQNNVAIETLTIAHEGITLMGGASGLAGAVRGAVQAIGSLF